MPISATLWGQNGFRFLYASAGFKEGLAVTGYLIYSDLTKSAVSEFDELGDGIYTVSFPFVKKVDRRIDKYGLVVKEDGETKHFEIVDIIT